MKLKLNIYFLILTSLVLGLLPLGQARAESYLKKASFVSLPVGSTAPTGVVNSSTASFRVEVELQDNFQPEKMSLFLDQKILPIDERIYDTGNNYIFSSNTRDNQELQSLLTEAGKSANGYHSLSLLADVSGDQVVIWNYSFFADFDSPCGNFSIQTPAEKNMLKVGDQVEIIYTAQSDDVKAVSAKLYSRDLVFTRVDNNFIAVYKIIEGDTDTDTLIVENVVIEDVAGNVVCYNFLELALSVSIDANSPTLKVLSPVNKLYGHSNPSLDYEASGYDEMEIWLDGNLVDGWPGYIADGSHSIRLVIRDLAGNMALYEYDFIVDTIAPSGILFNPPEKIGESESFELSGESESDTIVKLQLGDERYELFTKDGKFTFSIDGLRSGKYQIYLTFIDLAGNIKTLLFSEIEVEAKVNTVKVAFNETAKSDEISEEDVDVTLNLPELTEEITGSLGSAANDERSRAGFQAWTLFALVVVLSLFLSAISYNLYSKLLAARALNSDAELITKEFISEELIYEEEKNILANLSEENDESEKPKLRW